MLRLQCNLERCLSWQPPASIMSELLKMDDDLPTDQKSLKAGPLLSTMLD